MKSSSNNKNEVLEKGFENSLSEETKEKQNKSSEDTITLALSNPDDFSSENPLSEEDQTKFAEFYEQSHKKAFRFLLDILDLFV